MTMTESPPRILTEGVTGDLLPGVLEGPEDEGFPTYPPDLESEESVARRLGEAMEEAGFSEIAPFYRGVCAYGGYGGSYSTALSYHHGETMPSAPYLVAVARFTGTDVYWLATGREQPEIWAPVGEEYESAGTSGLVSAGVVSALLFVMWVAVTLLLVSS